MTSSYCGDAALVLTLQIMGWILLPWRWLGAFRYSTACVYFLESFGFSGRDLFNFFFNLPAEEGKDGALTLAGAVLLVMLCSPAGLSPHSAGLRIPPKSLCRGRASHCLESAVLPAVPP